MHTTFAIERAFRGPGGQVVVARPASYDSCSYQFEVGERYFVYGDRKPDGMLSVGPCSGTTALSRAQEDLEYAENLPPPGSGGRVFGRVTRVEPDLLDDHKRWDIDAAGVVVTLRNSTGAAIELRTDAEGWFVATGLKPDKYSVSLSAPPTARVYYDYPTFTIPDRGCAPLSIRYQSNGRIAGRIVDGDGLPVKGVPVSAFPRAFTTKDDYPNVSMKMASTNADGRYEIGPLPPGEYQLGVNVEVPPDTKSPYPPTYFPGVLTRAEAGTVALGEGEIGRADFVLPRKLARVAIRGTVVFADGTPAARVTVILGARTFYEIARTRTDATGSFRLIGLSGSTYRVLAFSSETDTSAETTISVGDEPVTGVTLVLKKD